MTDIDAIRKLSPSDQETLDTLCDIEAYFRKEYAYEVENAGSGGSTIAAGMWKRYFMALYNLSHDLPELIAYGPRLTALQVAYDAKCEELAEMQKKVSRLESLYSVTAKLAADSHLKANALYVASEHGHNLLTPLGQQVLDDADATRAERDAAHREKAAAMGLVEGHALTIAKLEAERDAAVRDAQRYRWLRSEEVNTDPCYYPFWEAALPKLCREEKLDTLVDKWIAMEFCEHEKDSATCGECHGQFGVGA